MLPPKPEIWIAEDNDDVRLLLARAFKKLDAPIVPVFFKDGAELVEHFTRNQSAIPILFLLDLQMPVMTGLQALKRLKAQGCCGASPVVIFSSLQDPEAVRASYSARNCILQSRAP